MEPLDWGDGDYARTAATLVPASQALLDFAGVEPGQDVLDVACGDGNAALAAAGRGASATGVDPAAVLIDQAAARAAEQGVECRWLVGDADALPVDDSAFDVVLSVFGVIFAPDPERAARELVRVVRPRGTIALTAWRPGGPIGQIGRTIFAALDLPAGKPRDWGNPDWTTALLEAAGAREPRAEETELAFTAASPEAWWQDQDDHHPMWRWARRQLGAERWAALRAESLEILQAGNEDPDAFRTTSRYLLVAASR